MTREFEKRNAPDAPAYAWRRLLAALLALAAAPGCGSEPPPATSPRPPLVVVAVDGLEWDVLLPLARAGRLPHLTALMERGTWGRLRTFEPTLSPVIWTTIATGKPPAEHGIGGFTLEEDGATRLYQSGDRRTKAVWDIVSDAEKRVAVIGWWASWPAEEVNGVCVTQMNTLEREVAKGGLLPDLPRQTWPPAFAERALATLRETDAGLDELVREVLDADPAGLAPLEARLFEHCLWSLRADATYARLAEELLAEDEPFDFLAVYLGSPDVFAHRFWRYREPARFAHPPPDAAVALCGDWIDRNAVWIDACIGRLVAAAGPAANVVVLSDHGVHADNQDGTYAAEGSLAELSSGHHLDAPPGVLVAAGPDVRAAGFSLEGEPRELATVYDVLPTWLAWLDLPIGRDMPGEVSEALISLEHLRAFPPRRIPTHDDAGWRASRGGPAADPGEAQRLRQLSDLGYLGPGAGG